MLFTCLRAANLIVFLGATWQGIAGPHVIAEVGEQNCTERWFGENCSYLCHCSANPAVCNYNGVCRAGTCENAHFGPGCQYVDLLSYFGTNTNPTYLTDADDSTCIQDTTATTVGVSLNHAMTFLWFRLTVKDQSSLLNFTVTLNIVEPCHNERRYSLSETEIDVSCDTTILLHTLELRGEIAHSLCSVRISGGRNVAMRQQTNQSSTRNVRMDISGPELAVDGNVDQDYYRGSCSHSSLETYGPSWRLLFNRPQILIRAVIYNRANGNDRNFVGNTLETFDRSYNLSSSFRITSSVASAIYEIMMLSRVPVTSFVIHRPPTVDFYYRLLNLCEVELYGETLCPEGTYGLFCNKICSCGTLEICNLVTGLCAPGCGEGKYGFNCSRKCSETCSERKCRNRHGECLQCMPGYTGEYCDTECLPGTYGIQCNQTCSVHCENVCNYRTGACTCVGNFSGSLCNDCFRGFHGENCTNECPKQCQHNICDRTSGFCERCQGLRTGPLCEDCPESLYGYLCYTKCSEYCGNKSCDKDDGSCSECREGYRGPLCAIAPIESVPWKYYIIPLPMLAMLVCLCTMFLLRRTTPRDSIESMEMSIDEDTRISIREPMRVS